MAFGHLLCVSDYPNKDISQAQKLFLFFFLGTSLLGDGVGCGVGTITTGIELLDGVIDGDGVLLACLVVLGVGDACGVLLLLGLGVLLREMLGLGVML